MLSPKQVDNVRRTRVLKPPGGESSNIFGILSGSDNSSEQTRSSRRGSRTEDTQSRLFGLVSEPLAQTSTPKKEMRNPITGEVYNLPTNGNTNDVVDEQPDEATNGAFKSQTEESPEHSDEDTESIKLQSETSSNIHNVSKPVVTKPIRVRHPPGGRSSGIF